MAYTLCKAVTKRYRTLDVYGCTPDYLVGENTCSCVQGTVATAGCCCAWTVPTGVRSITVELWGGGGGGGAGSGNECCGTHPGGGGAAYMKYTLSVTPGEVLTVCAGAAGRAGMGNDAGSSYCCCGAGGSCSFIARSGTLLGDAGGGNPGFSQCYESCGCHYSGCCAPCQDGCCYPLGAYFNGSPEMRAGPASAWTWGCDANCGQQMNQGAAAGYGGGPTFWNYSCNCWYYYTWQTGTTNGSGILGHGNFCCAWNIPSSACYSCSTTSAWISCGRAHYPPNGNFPGGGGPAGVKSACCIYGSSGGSGGAGYVRITY